MQLIEAALAFAITMLALSLVVSSFVEIIHRAFKMREVGLKYMLGQLFDQVLIKYIDPLVNKQLAENPALKGKSVQDAITIIRTSFIERMTANRAPVGLKPDPRLAVSPKPAPSAPAAVPAASASAAPTSAPSTPATGPAPSTSVAPTSAPAARATAMATQAKPAWQFGNIWGGREVTGLAPNEFMERLGSLDVGKEIENAAKTIGAGAADALDTLLKDIAQKFEGFGKDAATYFEGRARFMSVVVAMALAFFAHVDAVDLFRTYLRDPNARAKVIEQAQAVTAQHKAAQEAADALKKLDPNMGASTEEAKKQVEALKKDWEAAIKNANVTVKQYADLGVPIGWTKERLDNAVMAQWVWTCTAYPDPPSGTAPQVKYQLLALWATCKQDDVKDGVVVKSYTNVWFQVPTVLSVWFYLFLGGLLIGLGAPFWYDAVTGLTNIRNVARGVSGVDTKSQTVAAAATNESSKAQPVTPAGSFQVSNAGR